jgi:hypothetical protein
LTSRFTPLGEVVDQQPHESFDAGSYVSMDL